MNPGMRLDKKYLMTSPIHLLRMVLHLTLGFLAANAILAEHNSIQTFLQGEGTGDIVQVVCTVQIQALPLTSCIR